MTKQELEQVLKRFEQENKVFRSILYALKKIMEPVAEMFDNGLAEDEPYNEGIRQALSVISDTINAKLSKTSYLRCPTFKSIAEEEQKPTFTVIEGGLSKKKGGKPNNE